MGAVETIAIIPARIGSKSIPRKNLVMLAGKPLIAHSIEFAKKCPSISRVIVSTDSPEIASVSREFGAEVPFLRPQFLAQDSTPDFPVFEHCLHWLLEQEASLPEFFVHLRATSPVRSVNMIEKALQLLRENSEADSVRGVTTPEQNPYKMWKVGENGFLKPILSQPIPEAYNQPRQILPPVYWQVGSVDVARVKTVLEKKSMTGEKILPIFLDSHDAFDIDDFHELQKAGNFMAEQMP